jgi:IclR family pca regulon transcriptional regulator
MFGFYQDAFAMSRLQAADAERRQESDLGPDFLEALARGLRILSAFSAERRQMTLSDMAKAVALPRATVRRALYTLTHLGYVETDGRLFRLTPRVLRLATVYLTSNAASTVLQPCCERISAAVQEACSAAVLDGDEVVMIAHASPPRFIDIGPGVGFRLPAFCTSLGRVLLAALPDDALDPFLERLAPIGITPHTVTDKDRLRQEILTVRRQGFAFADQEAELGFRSIAVPVRRYDGVTVAALNLGARVERGSAETMREAFLPRLLAVAGELGEQLI